MFALVSVHFSLTGDPKTNRKAGLQRRAERKHAMNGSPASELRCVEAEPLCPHHKGHESEMGNLHRPLFVSLHRGICPDRWDHDSWGRFYLRKGAQESSAFLGPGTFTVSIGSSRPSLQMKNTHWQRGKYLNMGAQCVPP